jgi:hypothetical protein
MNLSQRIYLGSGNTSNVGNDAHIKVKLEQNINTIEFLSMSIDAEDVYQNFNSDYGVLVGRIIANDGVGVPNAKISIFIPLTDEDSVDSEIVSIYPYTTPRDKNNEGKRYNLLPRVSTYNQEVGQWMPKQPFGSFPIKEEIVTNTNILNVYKKYYKYTALTNEAGDYMIFGVPTGTQTVHMSVDITDIGKYSMNPASMVSNLGYSPNLFTNNNSRIKPSSDLTDLPNIETQEISVDIIPFWGDTENFEIGITRQDFRIRSVLNNTFVIFGNIFTDSSQTLWGDDANSSRQISELFLVVGNNVTERNTNVGITSKRTGKVSEKIYYYPPNISDGDIDNGNVEPDGSDMILLDPSYYSIYQKDGNFVYVISCNRKRIVTNEYGQPVEISYNSTEGVFTEFRGFITLEITTNDAPITITSAIGADTVVVPMRYKFKFPQHADETKSFDVEDDSANTNAWRTQSYKFEFNKFYSLSKFHGLTYNSMIGDNSQNNKSDTFLGNSKLNNVTYSPHRNVGIIVTGDIYDGGDIVIQNSIYKYPSNGVNDTNINSFGANWMNLSIYLPQSGYLKSGFGFVKDIRIADNFTYQVYASGAYYNDFFLEDNTQIIAGGDYNTKWFARSDLHWTDIIEVPLPDIKYMKTIPDKGFISSGGLTGNYRNGVYNPDPTKWSAPCPFNGGKLYGIPTSNIPDTNTYFYKGLGSIDCIEYLYELGLIN